MGKSDSRRPQQQSSTDDPQPANEHNLKKWDALVRYQRALQGHIAAGKIDPTKANWGDATTSNRDLSAMIQRSGVPWEGPLPGEQGLHSGGLSTGKLTTGGLSTGGLSTGKLSSGGLSDAAQATASAGRRATAGNQSSASASKPNFVSTLTADNPFAAPAPLTLGTGVQPAAPIGFEVNPAPSAAPAQAPSPTPQYANPVLQALQHDAANSSAPAPAPRAAYPQRPASAQYGKVWQEDAPLTVNPGETAYANGQAVAPGSTATPINPKYGGGFTFSQVMNAAAPSYTGGGGAKAYDVNDSKGPAGKFVGPDEAARNARLGSAAGSLAAPNSPIPETKQLDPVAAKAIVAQYPEIGQPGTWAYDQFMKQMKPGVNAPQYANKVLNDLITPPTPSAPLNPELGTPTIERLAPAVIADPKRATPQALPASTSDVAAPSFGLASGAPATPPDTSAIRPRPVSLGPVSTITPKDIAQPNPSPLASGAQLLNSAFAGLGASGGGATTGMPRTAPAAPPSLAAPTAPSASAAKAPDYASPAWMQQMGQLGSFDPSPKNPESFPGAATLPALAPHVAAVAAHPLAPDEEIGPDGSPRKKQIASN